MVKQRHPHETCRTPVRAKDIVQFSSAVYYCSEDEGKVEVEAGKNKRSRGLQAFSMGCWQVIRLGEDDDDCSVALASKRCQAVLKLEA